MRSRKSLVQVEVHHVDAEVAGAYFADQRVHVGAIHIEQRALCVKNVGDLVDLVFKNAERGRIGEHQRRGIFVDLARERFKIDAAVGVGLEILDLVAADGGGSGVGAMGRVGNDDLAARIALRLMPRTNQQDAGELAVRASCGLQGDGVHAGDIDEATLQQVDDLKHALRQRFGPVRMRFGETLDAGDEFVDTRVVLHGAGTERIHAEIDGVIPGGKAREVADDLDLAELRQQAGHLAVRVAQQFGWVHFRHVEWRQLVGLLARRGFLEDQPFVLCLVGTNLADAAIDLRLSCCHFYASTGAAASTFAARSMVSRAITSVAHQRVAFFSSGYQRPRSMPPTIFSSSRR